jgi:tetratricopeptide (TPR) repeat protein
MMNRIVLTAIVLAAVCVAWCAAEEVKVYEGTVKILTGPSKRGAPPPQTRPEEFKPVEHPAVYIENEYFRCCLLPQIGGRLYEVYNKASMSQVFFVNPYLEVDPDTFAGTAWNLGGVEVNFPYFHHGNTYNERWQWGEVRRPDGSAGVAMSITSRPTMQRGVFVVLLRPGVARVDLEYRFENLNPYPWGIAAWIDTMHTKTMETQFMLPSPWVAGHGHNRFRTHLESWPVRKGIDISWQKNLTDTLSEFAFMPRLGFHGCYEHATDRGAVRIFDPETLPAAKLWTQPPPVTRDQQYQHFEIWTATSAVMEDPRRQAELSRYTAADSWYQPWGIGGYVFANEDVAINLVSLEDASASSGAPAGVGGSKKVALLAGVCGTRLIPDCVVSLQVGHDTFYRRLINIDPAAPWKAELSAPPGDVTMEVTAHDGRTIARYELRTDELPQEQWQMPKEPRWRSGINNAYYEEDYSTLWRSRGHFFDGAIGAYKGLLKEDAESPKLMVDLARAYLKDEQVRLGWWYRDPGPKADADAVKRRESDLELAVEYLQEALKLDPQHSRARFYLGLALERQGKKSEAIAAYRAALDYGAPASQAAMYLARLMLEARPADAMALAHRAADAYPQSTRAKHLLMAAMLRAQKPVQAAEVGAKLYEADPSDAVTAQLLAEAMRQKSSAALPVGYLKLARQLEGDAETKKAVEAELRWLRGE